MGMSDSPLTRADLDALLIPAGEVFGRIFKATRGMTRDDALVVAQQIHLGTWVPPEREDRRMKAGSVWEFFVKLPFIPSTNAPNPMWASKSDVRRMIEQGAIRLNWHTDWKPDDEMPPIITEITLFPSGSRRTILTCISCGPSCQHIQESRGQTI